jgi:hypothetical protein
MTTPWEFEQKEGLCKLKAAKNHLKTYPKD